MTTQIRLPINTIHRHPTELRVPRAAGAGGDDGRPPLVCISYPEPEPGRSVLGQQERHRIRCKIAHLLTTVEVQLPSFVKGEEVAR